MVERISRKERLIADSIGFPSHYNETDAQHAETTPCDECGSSMNYVGYKRGSSFVSLAICSNEACDNGFEF